MRLFLISAAILSCVAIVPAKADVVAANGAVVVTGNRFLNADNSSRAMYRAPYNNSQAYDGVGARDNVVITGGGANNGGALIVNNGRVIAPQNGGNDLGNGSNINIDRQGNANGRVGNVDIRN